MAYMAVPFEKVLDLQVKTMKNQINCLEADGKNFLAQFKSQQSDFPSFNKEKFLILKGQKTIYSKSYQMGREAKKDILWVFTELDGFQFDPKLAVCNAKLRSLNLINITPKDLEKIKRLTKLAVKAGMNFETRFLDFNKEMNFNVLIVDDKNAMLIWQPKLGEDMSAFWTDSEVFVYVWRVFFEELWSKATEMSKKLQQFELKKERLATTS